MNNPWAQEQILEVAHDMLAGRTDLLIGSRIMTGLSTYVDEPEDEIFLTFVNVYTDIDRFPIGVARELCDPDYLVRVDEEVNAYLNLARDDIKDACRKVIEKFALVKTESDIISNDET